MCPPFVLIKMLKLEFISTYFFKILLTAYFFSDMMCPVDTYFSFYFAQFILKF